ncbi:immunoglobulin lambda-1 light chain-like isoform X3 [Ranitomeya imitator]|uniref:immunoglobulin lambda-1 light chain-like isoform X3 n=1 Tax=Ranitomeya imitator TaxID=111125 RepID=UPI0037E867FA
MSWFCLLLSLILCSAYASAQFTVTQDASVSSSLGESVRITCSRSGGSVTGGNYPAWYYQTPGSPPKPLIYSTSSNQNNRPSGVSDRFSGSISGVSAVLSISKVESVDEGNYYCCLYAGSDRWIFGEGTQLNVLTGEVKVPSVFIYGPSEEELKTDKATMVCAISAYTPRTVSVDWTVDGTKWTTGIQTSTESKQADNLYMKSSFISLSTSEYNKHDEYGCKVTHQGNVIMQTFKRSECH